MASHKLRDPRFMILMALRIRFFGGAAATVESTLREFVVGEFYVVAGNQSIRVEKRYHSCIGAHLATIPALLFLVLSFLVEQ
jgi:hypothetical protein